ncbi:PX domain-containing protein/DUF4206 domain-containing protein [Cephalotus follicularis]|uniref:PX domain-containing protein/DUF4206 domain-containing protein n=1 Tax=Cephalotus follicularis TaxID=3775 RepID=A0A1Q3AS02_CEPFO|nr:PX domain-containing protein/DUF4206 domain-containing protein [Cephalotus follicularis]
MINGEATHDEVAFPDPLDSPTPKSDGGDESPASPQYSSCGGSEFERYSSANSALGTPSLCSSIGTFKDCLDSEFGSIRRSNSLLENFSLEPSIKLSSSGNETSGHSGLEFYDNDEGASSEGGVELGGDVDDLLNRGIGDVTSVGFFPMDSEGNEREEGGVSSRYEHSEGEDSMYGYGTDDEHRETLYFKSDVQYGHEAKGQNETPFLMNTSSAFGSGDWDDFEQETRGGTLAWNSTSATSSGILDAGQTVQEKYAADEFIARKQVQDAYDNVIFNADSIGVSDSGESEQVKEVGNIPLASSRVQGVDELVKDSIAISFPKICKLDDDVRNYSATSNQDATECLNSCSIDSVFEMGQDPLVVKATLEIGLDVKDCGMEREHQFVDNKEVIGIDESRLLENQAFGNCNALLEPLTDITMNQVCSHSMQPPMKLDAESLCDCKSSSPPSIHENGICRKLKDTPSADFSEDISPLVKHVLQRQNLELNDFYDEVVHEMEEILLDSTGSPGFPLGKQMLQSQLSLPLRDGGSTASTSGTDYASPLVLHPLRIDGVEVVGARQKTGNVSLSERLVGVKEYTVYRIRVWRGKDQWEVERRYRDFFTLYRRLKSLYVDQGWILPTPWSSVEKESRKMFGNASPDVVSERTILIQECLRSILRSRFHSSPPSALIWFLSPQDSFPGSPASDAVVSGTTYLTRGADTENISSLGKTISLIVEIRPYKSVKQMLEAQHYTCAGCHKHFDDGMTLMLDFVQTFGWGKPRFCEYTGQLFCSSCHTNETAVLPARVLHHWDFTPYPVSQLAKSYLVSIHDQPMLCVSAVNPILFSKVSALNHVMGIRKKIGAILPYVRCPFRRSINKGLGSRRYLLESNDFFALRDLIDLSKGAFAALPVMVETVSRKILEHITEQCLVCCDVGIPCSARQACHDPSYLIFPFQEGEVEKCASCGAVFHKPCFGKITNCPCGAQLRVDGAVNTDKRVTHSASGGEIGSLDLLGRRSGSGLSLGLLPGLFSKAKIEKIKEHKESGNVILMGSLPGDSF